MNGINVMDMPNRVGNIVMPGGRPTPLIDIKAASELTVAAREAMRMDALKRALARAATKQIINADYSNALARVIRPTQDLNWGVNANQSWVTTALVAGTFNAFANSFQVPVNQLLVIYGISTYEASPSLSEMRFERGSAGQGGILSIVNLQTEYDKLEFEFYLSKGVLYDPQDIVYIGGLPFKANANGEAWILHGYTIEPIGVTLAAQPE